jgi:hypothetical protein
MAEFLHLTAETLQSIGEDAARSMRERAAQEIARAWPRITDSRTPAEQCYDVKRAVRALSLLSDSELPTVEASSSVSISKDEADTAEDADAEPCRSFTADPGHPDTALYCEHHSGDGHDGLHYADIAGRTRTWGWADAQPPPDFRARLVSELIGEDRLDAADLLHEDPVTTWEQAYVCWSMYRAELERYRRGESAVLDRVAQLEKDMGRIERDRAEDQSRLALLDDRLRGTEADLGPVEWSDAAAPGGYVCAAPTPTGTCGLPVESEPCREHALAGQLAAVIDRVDALELADRESAQPAGAYVDEEACQVKGRHPTIPALNMGCAYGPGHLSDHYNPSEGGWTWDADGNSTRINGEPGDDDEYRHCGATGELPSGDGYACARRVGHDGRCSPHRDPAEGGDDQ